MKPSLKILIDDEVGEVSLFVYSSHCFVKVASDSTNASTINIWRFLRCCAKPITSLSVNDFCDFFCIELSPMSDPHTRSVSSPEACVFQLSSVEASHHLRKLENQIFDPKGLLSWILNSALIFLPRLSLAYRFKLEFQSWCTSSQIWNRLGACFDCTYSFVVLDFSSGAVRFLSADFAQAFETSQINLKSSVPMISFSYCFLDNEF